MSVENNFVVIYSFKIIPGKENDFIVDWLELTKLIYEHAGSYGSRLHKVDQNFFMAYAQWPDKETWENSNLRLPERGIILSKQMRENCLEIKTEYQMRVLHDFLYDSAYTDNNKKSSQE
jgi:hypothetical protein